MSVSKRIISTSRSGMKVTSDFFFDRQRVIRAISKKEAAAMSRIGAFIMTTMRTSMKNSTKPKPHSLPGESPRVTEGFLRSMINFSYSPFRHTVVVGPEIKATNPKIKPSGKTIPELLNDGGTARSPEHFVLRDRQTGRIMSLASRAARMIMNSQSYRRSRGQRNARYYLMRMEAGPKRFNPRQYKETALAKNITQPKLKSAWSVIN